MLGCDMPTEKNRQSLNGKWRFRYDPESLGEKEGYPQGSYPKSDWQTVRVPGFWDDKEYDGIAWYACDFQLNNRLAKPKIAIVFDGVDDQAVVYLNGRKIREHSSYNIRFYEPVTSHINKDRKNHLVVKITDTGGSGGIVGDVYLQAYQEESELLKTEYHQQRAAPVPDWVYESVIYELYPRAYSSEGSLRAVTADIPRLKSLGIDCIWLMPIFPIGKIKRKGQLGSPYAIADYYAVNPEYGAIEDFRILVKTAHQQDMRIILDIAINHCAWDNELLQQHPDWFTRDKKGNIIPPAGTDWSDVADFNYDRMTLREYMREVLKYWVREFDIDGYRCDVAELVPYDFWSRTNRELREIKPDVLMLAEGAHPELYLSGFQLTYAWNTRLSLYKIINLQVPATRLDETMTREFYQYPQAALRMRFIENHDLQRSAHYFGLEESKVAAAIAFTLSGVPMIYAGQELGATSKPSLFEKEVIDWSQNDPNPTKLYQQLFQLRKEHVVLRRGEYKYLSNSNENDVISYARIYRQDAVVILANVRKDAQLISIDLNGIIEKSENIKILMNAADYSIMDNKMTIELSPYGFCIFKAL